MNEDEDIKDALEDILKFKQGLYGLINYIATREGLSKEEFESLVSHVNIDETWDSYYSVIIEELDAISILRTKATLDHLFKVEEKYAPMIENSIESFFNEQRLH